MTQIFLAIVFIVNGHAVFLPGFHPREAPNMAVCESRMDFTKKYLLESLEKNPLVVPVDIEDFYVICGGEDKIKAFIIDYNKGDSA